MFTSHRFKAAALAFLAPLVALPLVFGATAASAAPAPVAATTPAVAPAAAATLPEGWQSSSLVRGCAGAEVVAKPIGGVTRGFMSCLRGSQRVIISFMVREHGVTTVETGFRGHVDDMAWDGGRYDYVIGRLSGNRMAIGRFDEVSKASSALTLLPADAEQGATIAARSGTWWAVWVGPGGDLYQQRTMFTRQAPTRITHPTYTDFSPHIDVSGNTAALIWQRNGGMVSTAIRLARSTNGGAWASQEWDFQGGVNHVTAPQLRVLHGNVYAAWGAYRNDRDSAWFSADTNKNGLSAEVAPEVTAVLGGAHQVFAWGDGTRMQFASLTNSTWDTYTVPATGALVGMAQVGYSPGVLYVTGNQVRMILHDA